jgi:hypothetical protein
MTENNNSGTFSLILLNGGTTNTTQDEIKVFKNGQEINDCIFYDGIPVRKVKMCTTTNTTCVKGDIIKVVGPNNARDVRC